MLYDVFVMEMRCVAHINIQGFVWFFTGFLTLYRSDDDLTNGRKLTT